MSPMVRGTGMEVMHIAVLLLLALSQASAADHLVRPGTDTVDGEQMRIAPGDRVLVAGGRRGTTLTLRNLVGAAGRPVTVVNQGGQVEIRTAERGSALTITGCRFLRVTGTGDPAVPYGFSAACTRDGCHSVNVVGRSSDIEIDHVEVPAAGFAGFNVKDEPCVEGTTNRGAFTMYDIRLHHNFVHDTGGEGFYIGHTFSNGWDHDGKPATPELYPHFIIGLEIHDNLTRDTGCEGIQVGSTYAGLAMHGNTVERSGRKPFMQWQDNGIQIGYSAGMAWGNRVSDAPGSGIIVMTPAEVLLTGNLVRACGGDGIYLDQRLSSAGSLACGGLAPGAGYLVANNTVIDAGRNGKGHGIVLRAEDATGTSVARNNLVVVGHGRHFQKGGGTKLDQGGDLFLAALEGARLGSGDWIPRPDSPARNRGQPVGDLGIGGDGNDRERAGEGAPDVGAFESGGGPVRKPRVVVLRGTCDPGTAGLRIDGRPVGLDAKRSWKHPWPWPNLPREVLLTVIRADGGESSRRVPVVTLLR